MSEPQTPEAPKSLYEDAKQVCAALINSGFPTMFAGGCVRDRLLGQTPKDFDLATTAKPEEAKAVLEDCGFKILPIGLQHGTIGVLTQHQTVEITTLRLDLACDGRHAEVGFTEDFEADAKRRDFSINGIFEDMHGRIHDFVGGYGDLKRKRLRFIGVATARIREDYLRIMRYFRFLARLGWQADEEALIAITQERKGLRRIAWERITSEMDRLLLYPHAGRALEHADQTQCMQTLYPWYHSSDLARFVSWHTKITDHQPNLTWFYLLWFCGPGQKGPWLKREMEKLRFAKPRRLLLQQLFGFFENGDNRWHGYTSLLKMCEQQNPPIVELKAALQCLPDQWPDELVRHYRHFFDRLLGPKPELSRMDILSLPIEVRSEAILVAKIFWYLGWCGGKTQLNTVLLRAREFRPWLEKKGFIPPPTAMWGDA